MTNFSKFVSDVVMGAAGEKAQMTSRMLDIAAADHGLPAGSLKTQQIPETGAVAIVPMTAPADGTLKNYGVQGSNYWDELKARAQVQAAISPPPRNKAPKP